MDFSKSLLRGLWLLSGGAIALASLALFQAPSSAQGIFGQDEFDDPNQGDGGSQGGVNSVFDLIHRENFRNNRSPREIQQDRQNNIRGAVESFRQQQETPRLQPIPSGQNGVVAPSADPNPTTPTP